MKTKLVEAQARCDEAGRQLQDAVLDFNVPDEKVLEIREKARRAFQEIAMWERQAAKKHLLSFLKFW
jgi:hypothetical protein